MNGKNRQNSVKKVILFICKFVTVDAAKLLAGTTYKNAFSV